MSSAIHVRVLTSVAEFHRCVDITRDVWGDSELEIEPHITFVIAAHTGGQVLGAFDGDQIVGFVKAYVGLHDQTPYLHSHMAAVLPSHRDRGVGRALKLFQREDALRRGFRLIEWTFDPLETRNAHFNINRLGAIARRYIPNFYGITTSPLHRGIPTDRLVAEWHLDSPRVLAAISDLTPDPRNFPAGIHLPAGRPAFVVAGLRTGLPAPQGGPALSVAEGSASPAAFPPGGPPSVSEGGFAEASSILETQCRIRQEFTGWFARGYAALAVRSTPSGTDYLIAPWSDF